MYRSASLLGSGESLIPVSTDGGGGVGGGGSVLPVCAYSPLVTDLKQPLGWNWQLLQRIVSVLVNIPQLINYHDTENNYGDIASRSTHTHFRTLQ